MAIKRRSKHSISLSGQDARDFMCVMSTDKALLEQSNNEHLAPEMRDSVLKELARRELIADNYQI